MTKECVKAYLEGVNGKNIKLGLEPITALMEAVGWPDENLKIIHVTGTNGKGSVCEMMSRILQYGGYSVGTYNTPYFEEPNECICVNHQMISDETLIRYMNQIEPILKELDQKGMLPSGFEILTALALLYFKDMKVDFAILEVGLGGRLDATNVIRKSCLSIITKIAMDHTDFLGNSLSKIAREKAGIIKANSLVVTPLQEDDVIDVITERCKEQEARLKIMNPSDIQSVQITEEETSFLYKKQHYNLRVSGRYQAYNASIAITAMQFLKQEQLVNITDEDIKEGLKQTKWPGRFEKVREKPLCFIDGAHNVDGIMALAETLQALPKRKTIAIIGILRDKEVEKILKIITPYIDFFIVTKPLNPRAMEVEILAQKIAKYTDKIYMEETVDGALVKALKLADGKEDIQILGFGSLYMIGYLRTLLLKEK